MGRKHNNKGGTLLVQKGGDTGFTLPLPWPACEQQWQMLEAAAPPLLTLAQSRLAPPRPAPPLPAPPTNAVTHLVARAFFFPRPPLPSAPSPSSASPPAAAGCGRVR